MNNPLGNALSPSQTTLYVIQQGTFSITALTVFPPPTVTSLTVLAGGTTSGTADGAGTSAQFDVTQGIILSSDGLHLYTASTSNIRRVTIASSLGKRIQSSSRFLQRLMCFFFYFQSPRLPEAQPPPPDMPTALELLRSLINFLE